MSTQLASGIDRRLAERRFLTPQGRILAFSAVLGVIGIAAFALVVPRLETWPASINIGLPLFAAIYFIAEAKVIDVHFRGGTHTFSLTEVPAVMGLFFVSPSDYVIGIMLGATLALLRARLSLPRIAFNMGQFLIGAVASLAVFHAIVGLGSAGASTGLITWVAAFAAMLTVSALSAVLISMAVTLSGRDQQFRRIPEALQVGGLFAITNTALALLVVEILLVKPEAVWLVVIPVAMLFVAYRAYLSERQKHESLESLYQSSQIFQRSPEIDSAILAFLKHARVMFGTDVAEMVLYGADGTPLRTSVGPGQRTETMAVAPERTEILNTISADPRSIILENADVRPSSGGQGKVAMVSPLRGESGIIGAMLVAGQTSEAGDFTPDQLRMLETVTNQAAVALENGQLEQSLTELSRLKEELRHQAFHDALTGLANRAMFAQVLDDRIASARRPGGGSADEGSGAVDAAPPIVLFLDMDDFKIVNDTVGHDAGDQVLQEVAKRLIGTLRDVDLAARLGGDEFAVLLEKGTSEAEARAIADRLAARLAQPIRLAEREFIIGASIGMAVGDSAETVDDLLRNADIAMYVAKANGKRQLVVWSPEMHEIVVERHTLTSELSWALEAGEVRVAYQPIVALDGRGVVGFEALARWHHPSRGPIAPDVFIRLAEENGAIIELGRSVLIEACREAASWSHKPGFEDMILSVNLSPRQVHDPDFVAEARSIIEASGFPPERLVLEMTETAIFADVDLTIGKLEALRAFGIRIAIDDFGTGYSSLQSLRRFPVDMIKLAREFVAQDGEDDDWEFARAIVMLGRTLGVDIIAEGIETPRQRRRLTALGCDYGQGFIFGHATEPRKLRALVEQVEADGWLVADRPHGSDRVVGVPTPALTG